MERILRQSDLSQLALGVVQIRGRTSNRVVVGVNDQATIAKVQELLEAEDVPLEAVSVYRARIPHPLSHSLGDEFDPVPGGVEIGRESESVEGACTHGFNAVSGSEQWSITASHCTNDPFEFDNMTTFEQDEGGRIVGDEADDSTWEWCAGNTAKCADADAAGIAYEDTVDADQGFIAKPDTFGSDSVASEWRWFKIASADSICPLESYCGALDGDSVAKVGERTSWLRGQVEHTCLDADGADGFRRICTASFKSVADSGDSGAPVFQENTQFADPGYQDVSLRGLLWGAAPVGDSVSTDSLVYFTQFERIEDVLGDLCVEEQCVIPEFTVP